MKKLSLQVKITLLCTAILDRSLCAAYPFLHDVQFPRIDRGSQAGDDRDNRLCRFG